MSSEYNNVPEIDNTPSVRISVSEQVFIANARTLPARRVPLTAALFVAERVLARSTQTDATARAFAVERAVDRFLELATNGARTDQRLDNLDLLPVSHPLSTAPVTITASALNEARAEWLAADPRIAEEVRPLVAAAYTAEFGSLEREHALARLEATPSHLLPRDITALVAVGGNSSLARSRRAKRQLRDRLKRFAFEGKGAKFLVRLGNKVKDSLGLTVGGSNEKGYVEVYMDSDDPELGIKKGDIIKVDIDNFEAASVLLTDEQLAKAGIKLPKSKVSSAKRAQDIEELLANKLEAPGDWSKKANGDWETEDGFTATPLGDNKYALKDESGNPVEGLEAAEWPEIQQHIMKVAEDEFGNGLPNIDERPEGEQVSPTSLKKGDKVTNPKNNEVREVKDVFQGKYENTVTFDDGESAKFDVDDTTSTMTKLPADTPLSEPDVAYRKKKADEYAAQKKKAEDHNAWVKEKNEKELADSLAKFPVPEATGEENGQPTFAGPNGMTWKYTKKAKSNLPGWELRDENGTLRAEIIDYAAAGYVPSYGVRIYDENGNYDAKATELAGAGTYDPIIKGLGEAIARGNGGANGEDMREKNEEAPAAPLGAKDLPDLEDLSDDEIMERLGEYQKKVAYDVENGNAIFTPGSSEIEKEAARRGLTGEKPVEKPVKKAAPKNKPSKKQKEMIRSMLKERVMTSEQRQEYMDRLATIDKFEVSDLFNELKALPKAKVPLTDLTDPLNNHEDSNLAMIKQQIAPFDLDGSIRRYIDERTANGGEISGDEIRQLLNDLPDWSESGGGKYGEYEQEKQLANVYLGKQQTTEQVQAKEKSKAEAEAEKKALDEKLTALENGQADLTPLDEAEHQAKLEELASLISDDNDPDRVVRNGILNGNLRTGDEIIKALRKQEKKNEYKTMSPTKFATSYKYISADESKNPEEWAIINAAYGLPPAPEGFESQFLANELMSYDNENGDLAALINGGASGEEILSWLEENSTAWKSRLSDYDTRMYVDMPWPAQKASWKKFGELLTKIGEYNSDKESPNLEFIDGVTEKLPQGTIQNLDLKLGTAFNDGDTLSELLAKVDTEEDLQRVVDEISATRATNKDVTPQLDAQLEQVQDATIKKFYEDNPELENVMAEPANIVVPAEPESDQPELTISELYSSLEDLDDMEGGYPDSLYSQVDEIQEGADNIETLKEQVADLLEAGDKEGAAKKLSELGDAYEYFAVQVEIARQLDADAFSDPDFKKKDQDKVISNYQKAASLARDLATAATAAAAAAEPSGGNPANQTDKPNYTTEFAGLREPEFMAEEVGLEPQGPDGEDWTEQQLMDAWLSHYGLDKLGVKYGKLTPSFGGYDVELEIPEAAKDDFAQAYGGEDWAELTKDEIIQSIGAPNAEPAEATPDTGNPANQTDKPNYTAEFSGLREPEYMADEVGLPAQNEDDEDWTEEELMDAWLKHYGLDKLGVKYGKITPSYGGHDVELEIPDVAKDAFAKAYANEDSWDGLDDMVDPIGEAPEASEVSTEEVVENPFSTANSDKLLLEAKTNRKEIEDVDFAIATVLDTNETGYEPMLKGITGNENVVKNLLDSLDESDGANNIAIAGDLYALHDALVKAGTAPLVTEHIKDIADALDEFIPADDGDKNNTVTIDAIKQEQGGTLDLAKWNKVGGQKGSNPGGTYENPETGEQVYVKTPKSKLHAENERLASALYDAAGIPSAKVLAGKDVNGKDVTYSPLIDGATPDLQKKMKDKEYLARLQQGFAIDALLGNWDVIGLQYDNVVTDKNGEPVRVDPGGALLFRAQGAPKGDAFGEDVPELDSFTDKNSSRPAAKIFSQMTEQQKIESAKVLQNLSPSQIDELVNAIVTDPEKREELKKKLKARREFILNRFGLGDGGNDGGNGGQEPNLSPEAPEGLQPVSMQDVLKGKMQGSPADTSVLSLGDENIRTEAAKSVQSQLPDGYTATPEKGLNNSGFVMVKNAQGETVAMMTNDPDDPSKIAVQNFKAGWKTETVSSVSEGMSKLVDAVKVVEEPGQVVQLSDGSTGKIGAKVEHTGTGEKGTIVKFDKNPAYVVVKGEDGKTKTKSINKLKAAGDGGTPAPATEAPQAPSAPETPAEPVTFMPNVSENQTLFISKDGKMAKVTVIKTFEGKWDVVYDFNGPDFKPLHTDLASREEAEAKALTALGTNNFESSAPAKPEKKAAKAEPKAPAEPKKFTFDFMGLKDVEDAPEVKVSDDSLDPDNEKIKADANGTLIKPGAIIKDENGRVGVFRTLGYGDPNKIRVIWEDGTQESVMPNTVTATGKYIEPGIAGVYAGLAALDFEKNAVPMPDNYSGSLKDKNGKNIGYQQLVIDKNGDMGVVVEHNSYDGYIKVAYPDGTKKRKADTVTALDLRYTKDEYSIKNAQKTYKHLSTYSGEKYNLPTFGAPASSSGPGKPPSGKISVSKNAAGAKAQEVKNLSWNESDFEDAPSLEELLAMVSDTSKPGSGLRGGSIALDADSVEDLDLRVMAASGTNGEDAYLLKYKLTSWAGDALANQLVEMVKNGDPRVSVISGMKIPENIVDGDKVSFAPALGQKKASYQSGYGETFVITLDDGTKIHFMRADFPTKHKSGAAKIASDAPKAYHNKVMIIAPKDKSTPESLAIALQTAGVQDVRPSTQEDAKILIENRLMSIFDEKVDPKSNVSGKEREESLARIKANWGIGPENITIKTGAGGRIEMRLDEESAKKIVKKTGVKVLRHNLTGNSVNVNAVFGETEEQRRERIAAYFVGRVATPQGGLLSTTTRWSEGVPTGGMSSSTDISTGGGDYVFTTPSSNAPQSHSQELPLIYFSAERAFQRLDFWANQSDQYGKRIGKSPIDQAVPGGYEVMFKGRLSFEDAEVLMVNDQDMRTRVITKLRQQGITELGGRPLEAVIMTGQDYWAAKAAATTTA